MIESTSLVNPCLKKNSYQMSFEALNTTTQKATPAADVNVLSAQNDFAQNKNERNTSNKKGINIQPRLTVGAPDDPYEREADSVADRVMRMPEQDYIQSKGAGDNYDPTNLQLKADDDDEQVHLKRNATAGFLQKKCSDCEKDGKNKIRKKPISESITPFIQAKSEDSGQISDGLSKFIQSSRGAGSQLNDNSQAFMGNRFGNDFSNVKVHTDSDAVQMNRQLNAKAFTVGNDIYFNEAQYDPGSSPGKQLLAHELTHVVQQTGSAQTKSFLQRKCSCEKDEKIQRQELNEEDQSGENTIQTKPVDNFLAVQRKCEECTTEEEKPLQRKALNGGSASFIQARTNHPLITDSQMGREHPAETNGHSWNLNGKPGIKKQVNSGFGKINSPSFTGHVQRREEAPGAPVVAASVCAAYNTKDAPADAPTANTDTSIASPEISPDTKPVKPTATKNETVTPPAAKPGSKKPATGSTGKNKKNAKPDNPAFNAVLSETHKKAKKQKDHEEAEQKVLNAEEASKTKDEQAITSGAVVLAVDGKVNEEKQQPKEFNAEEFKKQLKEKITSGVPNEESGAREFIKDDKQVTAITQDTKANVNNAQGEVVSDAKKIDSKNEADDGNKNKIFTRTGIDYEAEKTGAKPAILNPERAIPKPVSDDQAQMDEEHDADSLDKTMQENDLTDDQLAESEEPKFIDTLQAKQKSQQELCKVPGKLKDAENAQLQQTAGSAQSVLNQGMGNMFLNRDGNFKNVDQGQHTVKTEEEKRLQDYYNKITFIHATTELNVKNRLSFLECSVGCVFEEALAAAFDTFKSHVTSRLDYYYDWHIVKADYEKEDKMTRAFVNAPLDEKIGALEYRKIFLRPNSPERNELQTKIDNLKSKRAKLKIELIFDEEKTLFIRTLDTAIDGIATMVAAGLNEAKGMISKGRAAVEEEYCCLDGANKEKAKETTDDFLSKFDDLDNKVNDKEAELGDTLARQYNETASKLKDTFETIRQEAALHWWERAWRKIKEIATLIYDLGKTLLNILVKAASVIGDIIRHPIRFFENLIEGITRGFKNFVKRIPQHLEEIIFKLIMGVVPPEIELPAQWDLKGIFSFVLDVLGFSKDNIRKQAIDRFGEPIVEKLEQTFELFVIFRNEGFAGLWEYIKEKIGNLKDAIIEEVKTFFQESIIQAAVEFLISALTPASGFIKVCKSIIGIVMFLVKNLQNLLKLLDNILDSLADIAMGKVDKAANKVENAITDILLIGIKFLAALVGINLDKIQAKISKIINAVRNPVNRALKWLFDKAETFARKSGLLKLFEKGKEKYDAGKQWAKGKIEKGKEMVKGGVKIFIGAFDWRKTKKSFKAHDGKTHSLYVAQRGGKPVVIVESDPTLLSSLLVQLRSRYKKDNAKLTSIGRSEELLGIIDQYAKSIKKAEVSLKALKDETEKQRIQNEIEDAYDAMMAVETALTTNLNELIEKEDYGELSAIYGVEGLVGVHAHAPKKKNMFEADHQPSNKMIQTAAAFPDAPAILKQISASRSSWASTITLHKKRHVKGRTYGSKAKPIARHFVEDVKTTLAGEKNQTDKRLFIEVLIQKQAKEDAQYMLDLVHGSPVEDDLWSDINGQPKGKELREKIVSQIERGESLMKNEKVTIPLNLPV